MSFKNGNIVRIFIKNFLTIDNTTLYPKPYLNLIFGPNGSGKSTVLCAICICLGGKPEVTGRSKNLESYIKHGKTTATLEVELFTGAKHNVIIRREFNNQGSQWHLQGKSVSKKEIENAVAKFGIQIDNLCTFLPQDRVANFAKMNSVQLLEATEKAVGDPQLFEYHELLRNSGGKMQEVQVKLKNLENEIEELQKKNAGMKDMVESVQEKKKLEEGIKELEMQRTFHQYQKKRLAATTLQKEIDEVTQNVEEERKLLNPLNKQIQECKESSLLQKRALHDKIIKSQEALQKVSQLCRQEDKLGDDTKALAFDFNAKKEAAQQQKADLENYKKHLELLENSFKSLPAIDEEEVRRNLQKLTMDITTGSSKLSDISNELDELVSETQGNKRQIKHFQTKMKAAQDVTEQRFELLRRRNADAHKAAQWLKANSHEFSSPFYMPICVLINLSDSAYADVVESTISFSDLIAFVFEDKDDMNIFKSKMDQRKLRVNIIHSVPNDSYKAHFPLNQIRKWGFDIYMSDVIKAPPAVLSYLHKTYSIHNIPIAKEEGMDYDKLPDKLSLFFLGKLKVLRNRSRYDNEVIIELSKVRPGSLLNIIYDYNLIEHCELSISECQKRITEVEKKIEELKIQEKSVNGNLERWRNDKQSYLSREQERTRLMNRINAKVAQIKRCEQENFNEKEEESKMQIKLLRTLKSRLACLEETGKLVSGSVLAEYYKIMGQMKTKELFVKNMKDIIDSKGERLQTLEEEKERKEEELKALKSRAMELLKQLCSALNVKKYSAIPRELIYKFTQTTEDSTEDKLCELKARRDCLHTADEEEIRDYNERENKISRLQECVKSYKTKTSRQFEEIESIRSSWIPSVTELVQNISSSFTGFMERLNCSGEIELASKDEHDYSKYGIELLVRFRGGDKLRVLTAQHQSGGERALATALYMLSLQNLTSVPFRCVDEINQGMDPMNERMMLLMMMETAAKEESSQYFFVSPKLLRGLQYNDRVNTMVVYNGPVQVQKYQFLMKKLIKQKQKQNKEEMV